MIEVTLLQPAFLLEHVYDMQDREIRSPRVIPQKTFREVALLPAVPDVGHEIHGDFVKGIVSGIQWVRLTDSWIIKVQLEPVETENPITAERDD